MGRCAQLAHLFEIVDGEKDALLQLRVGLTHVPGEDLEGLAARQMNENWMGDIHGRLRRPANDVVVVDIVFIDMTMLTTMAATPTTAQYNAWPRSMRTMITCRALMTSSHARGACGRDFSEVYPP